MLTDLSTTGWKRFVAKLELAVVILCVAALSQRQPNTPHQATLAQPPAVSTEIRAFLPATAILIKDLSVNFWNDTEPGTVLAYAVPDKSNPYNFTAAVRVLKHDRHSGWTVAFDESSVITNGAGPSDGITIEKITSAAGKDAVVVILKISGAGTTTDWHLIATVGGKLVKIDPTSIRNRVLKHRKYVFQGYNGVASKGDLVIEDVPGYSHGRARCCPDRPSVDLVYKFSGDSIKLQSVKELPFTLQE